MAKFINQTDKDEEVLFCQFGTLDGKDKDTTYLVKEGETIEGIVTSVKGSTTYRKSSRSKSREWRSRFLYWGKQTS